MAKQAGAHTPSIAEIPDKLYFRIGEVASLCKVETYVLRFWQTEFAQLKPVKSGTGQRLYRRRDVEMALRIKRLLHEEGYTIAGARQVFASEADQQRRSGAPLKPAASPAAQSQVQSQPELALRAADKGAEAAYETDRAQALLARLRVELGEIHGMLSGATAGRDGAPSLKESAKELEDRGSEGQDSGSIGQDDGRRAHEEASLFEHGPS